MNPETFLDRFGQLAETPNGIKKLRELILQLAVQGKLVPQNPDDEPASEMLKRIEVEKQRLVAEKKIKNPKALPPLEGESKPYPLPAGWIEISLAKLGNFCGGKTPSKSKSLYWNGDIPWVSPKDMKGLRVLGSQDLVSQAAVGDGLALIPKRSVLIVARSGILRRMVPVAISEVDCTINQDLKALTLYEPSMAEYVQLMVRGFERFILTEHTKTGTTVESLVFDTFARQSFPLPPLAEQQRIVAKVEELMAHCDELEAKQQQRADTHTQLLRAVHHPLTEASTAAEFQPAWQRVRDHFDQLYITPDSVQQLRQTILQLAVQGKLVPQDPNDEPASELLKCIEAEKQRLVAEKKIKKPKTLPPMGDDEKPYPLPKGWKWAQCAEIANPETTITYGILKPVWVSEGVPTVRIKDMVGGEIKLDDIAYCSSDRASKFTKTTLQEGDLLIAKDGATLGKTAFVPATLEGGNITQHVLRLSICSTMSLKYIRLIIDSPIGQGWMSGETKGVALPGVNVGDFRRMPMAIPPLNEQHRIVDKMDELTALCDALETRLQQSQVDGERLMESVVAHLATSVMEREVAA